MANDLTFTQVADVLNSVVKQATGVTTMTPTNTREFVNVASTALQVGYDPVLRALTQVMSRTIYSIRPYYRKFSGLEVSLSQWGNHIRKISIADKDFTEDDAYKYPVTWDDAQTPPSGDGKSVDQYVIRKPDLLQTNFYGNNVFQDYVTIYKNQIDTAFTSPEEFGRFLSMVMMNMSDKREQAIENVSRATVVNLIGGIIAEGNSDRVVHLVSEYNDLTGLALTSTSVFNPDNFKPFMQWVFGKIAQLTSLMTERTQLFQTVINNKRIIRHTPYREQKVYLYAPAQYQITAQVLADTYHDSYLRFSDHEVVNFWQSVDSPDSIKVNPVYTGTDGSIKKTTDALEQSHILGIIFDREAAGFAITQQWSMNTPMNARGGYSNYWNHETFKAYNDNTEKAIVLLLD